MLVATPSLSARAPARVHPAPSIPQLAQLEALIARLQLQAGIVEEVELEDALHALHASATALDFRALQVPVGDSLALRKAHSAAAAFSLQASRLRADADRVAACLGALAAGNASRTAGSPRLLLQFRAALRGLEQSLASDAKQAAASQAGPLAQLQAFCAHARSAHRLSQERTSGRLALEERLARRVLQPCAELQDSLRTLLAGAGDSPASPAAVATAIGQREQLQGGLVQACAEIMRLHDCDHALGERLAGMARQGRLAG